jgi:hypothetical protein
MAMISYKSYIIKNMVDHIPIHGHCVDVMFKSCLRLHVGCD